MTVATTNSTQTFAGGQSVLTFNFRTLTSNPAYIQVNVVALTGGTVTALVYNVGYTVIVNSSGVGGTVTITPTYGTNYQYVVYRQTAIVQNSEYTDYNQFPATTIENNLDQLTMIEQENLNDIDLCLSYPVGTSTTYSTIVPVPSPNTFLGWDPTGTYLINTTVVSNSTTLLAATAPQAQAGTNNSAYMTPTMVTVAIAQFGKTGTVTSVSSSTADIVVVSTSTTPIITANAATGGSNVLLRLDSSGKLPALLDGSQLINILSGVKSYGASSSASTAISSNTLKIAYGSIATVGNSASVSNLSFSSSTSYIVSATCVGSSAGGEGAPEVSQSSGAIFWIFQGNGVVVNWTAIGV